jgi:glyoxylase-like metal-dependent hydrolase (beta-lactamase superfamily II)
VRIGEFECVPLTDGAFRLDGGAMFGVVPKVLWERRAPADERNRIALGLRPLLVRTGRHTILIDAGAGDKYGPKELEIYQFDARDQLETSLASAGARPDDVDLVVATHLHWDHVGGLTTRRDGRVQPRFPRARHIVRRGEWDLATHPNERTHASYVADDFVPLMEAGLIDFIDEDADVVPGVRVERTGGHTAHHQVVRIESGGRVAIFAADLIPTSAHVDPDERPCRPAVDSGLRPLSPRLARREEAAGVGGCGRRVRYLLRARSGHPGRRHSPGARQAED